MSQAADLPDCGQLIELQQSIDASLLRDIPPLRKQLLKMQPRCREQQAVGRGVERLAARIAQSRQCVERRMAGAPSPTYPLALPVVERRESILAAIRDHPVVILCGETGSGKTTQLPKICLELGRGARGKIGHTQPRRIAARSLAARIAGEMGEVPCESGRHQRAEPPRRRLVMAARRSPATLDQTWELFNNGNGS